MNKYATEEALRAQEQEEHDDESELSEVKKERKSCIVSMTNKCWTPLCVDADIYTAELR